MRMWVQSLALLSGLRIWCCCGVGQRCGSDLVLSCHCRPAAAVPIRTLALGTYICLGTALKKSKKKKNVYGGVSIVAQR